VTQSQTIGQSQKPKLYWMAILSLLMAIVGVSFFGILRTFLNSSHFLAYLVLWAVNFLLIGGIVFGYISDRQICRSQGELSGRLFSRLGAYLPIIFIVLHVLLPRPFLVRTRFQVTKWSEGKAMAGCISTYIKDYASEKGPDRDLPEDNDFKELGFLDGDLDGTYFNQKMISFNVQSLDPLKFTITVRNEELDPNTVTLDQDGNWTESE